MELDVFKILLRHAQHVARIGKKDIAPLNILGHVLVLALLEALEFLLVICLYPASLVKMHGLPAALGVVLVLQAVLDNLELQLTCLLYTSPSPRDGLLSRMPSSA